MNRQRMTGIAAAIISSGTFGLIPLFSIPLMRGGMGETSVLFYRCLFSAVAIGATLLPKLLKRREKGCENPFRIAPGTGLRIAGMSLVYCSTAIALLLSYRYVSSGVVTTIHFLYPVIVALLMAAVYRERCTVRLVGAALVTLVGVASLSWTSGGLISTKGLILALSTAVSYAVYIVGLNHGRIKSLDGRIVMLLILLMAALVFGTVSLAAGGISPIHGPGAWLNLAMLALLPTIVSNIALLKAVKYAGATTTSILGSAEPVVAVLFGVSVFSEELTPTGILGLLMIIAAVTYVILYGTPRKNFA